MRQVVISLHFSNLKLQVIFIAWSIMMIFGFGNCLSADEIPKAIYKKLNEEIKAGASLTKQLTYVTNFRKKQTETSIHEYMEKHHINKKTVVALMESFGKRREECLVRSLVDEHKEGAMKHYLEFKIKNICDSQSSAKEIVQFVRERGMWKINEIISR